MTVSKTHDGLICLQCVFLYIDFLEQPPVYLQEEPDEVSQMAPQSRSAVR
jgi:hypothetical protein